MGGALSFFLPLDALSRVRSRAALAGSVTCSECDEFSRKTEWRYAAYHDEVARHDLLSDVGEEDRLQYAALLLMLETSVGLRHLGSYGRKLGASASLLFWSDGMEFRAINLNSTSFRRCRAQNIHKKYVAFSARVKLNFLDRDLIGHCLEALKEEPCPANAFIDPLLRACLKDMYQCIYLPLLADEEAILAYETERDLKYNAVCMDDFECYEVLGVGSFGRVLHVMKHSTGRHYAMKVQLKTSLMKSAGGETQRMFLEKEVYTQSSHPFIVQMAYAFTSKCYAILVLQLARTGTLQDALVSYPEGWLSENAALFYTAEIACALLHLHSLGLMYRDLKPRNALIGEDGHVLLADMGAVGRFKLADGKRGGVLKEIRRITVTGTKGYMAPEVAMLIGTSRDASRRGYTSAVDWWSLGATLFKMVTGKRPYDIEGKRLPAAFRLHQSPPPGGSSGDKRPLIFPDHVSATVRDLILQLMQEDDRRRLGSGNDGAVKLKGHAAFHHIDWNKLEMKQCPAPYVPQPAIEEQYQNKKAHNYLELFEALDKERSQDVSKRRSNKDWYEEPSEAEQHVWKSFNYIAPATLRVEMGIANELVSLNSSYKAQQLLLTS